MKTNTLKKGIVSLALVGSFVIGVGATNSAQAQGWRRARQRERRVERQYDRIERAQVRGELDRIRQLDRQQRLRYQARAGNRLVGYYDRFGRFQAVGYYDRSGNFYRYR